MKGVNLSNCDLRNTIFWGANLAEANLGKADLKRANMNWSILNKADLQMVDLNSAQLANVQLINTKLQKATIKWANLEGALLNEANFDHEAAQFNILKQKLHVNVGNKISNNFSFYTFVGKCLNQKL